MGGTKGYRSYRGRTSKGKIALAVLLVLIILAAVGFLWLQEYIVYDRDGSFHLELPWKTETPPAEEEVPPEDVEITIQEPEKPKALAAFSASAAPLTQAGWKDAWLGASVMSAPAYNAAAVTLKDSTGHIYFAATGAAAGTVSTAEDTEAALAEVTESSYHSIGRMSCFLDPIAARADVEGMGLKNTGGYIFYDGNNGNWLDPSKPAARQYLCTLAAELAQQGFDEILLENEDSRNQKTLAMWSDAPSNSTITVQETDRHLTLCGKNFTYNFNKLTGLFAAMQYEDAVLLDKEMEFNIWRAPTDNDRKLKLDWLAARYDHCMVP